MSTNNNNHCSHCGISNKHQHTLSESGRCDAIRKGKFTEWSKNVGKKLPKR